MYYIIIYYLLCTVLYAIYKHCRTIIIFHASFFIKVFVGLYFGISFKSCQLTVYTEIAFH